MAKVMMPHKKAPKEMMLVRSYLSPSTPLIGEDKACTSTCCQIPSFADMAQMLGETSPQIQPCTRGRQGQSCSASISGLLASTNKALQERQQGIHADKACTNEDCVRL